MEAGPGATRPQPRAARDPAATSRREDDVGRLLSEPQKDPDS